MQKRVKFLIGLAAALAAGVIAHWPLGRGEAFIAEIEAPLQPYLDSLNVPGVTGSIQREPLARIALLDGPADCFQRDGQGSLPGITKRVANLPGMAGARWLNPPPEGECR